jgi:hypothetical protein
MSVSHVRQNVVRWTLSSLEMTLPTTFLTKNLTASSSSVLVTHHDPLPLSAIEHRLGDVVAQRLDTLVPHAHMVTVQKVISVVRPSS